MIDTSHRQFFELTLDKSSKQSDNLTTEWYKIYRVTYQCWYHGYWLDKNQSAKHMAGCQIIDHIIFHKKVLIEGNLFNQILTENQMRWDLKSVGLICVMIQCQCWRYVLGITEQDTHLFRTIIVIVILSLCMLTCRKTLLLLALLLLELLHKYFHCSKEFRAWPGGKWIEELHHATSFLIVPTKLATNLWNNRKHCQYRASVLLDFSSVIITLNLFR